MPYFSTIKAAYEKGVKREEVLSKYRRFKEIVPSMAEEKTIFRDFEDESGYGSYEIVKQTKTSQNGTIIKGTSNRKR